MSGNSTDGSDDPPEDPILQRVLSDSAYDRVRIERFSHFKQPVPQKLLVQSLLVSALALALPLYLLYPASAASYLPTADPAVASPVVLVVGLFALVLELGTAALLVGVVVSRARNEPLTERKAERLFTAETFATYVGFGTGGLATLATVGLLALGLGGEPMLASYVETASEGPFRRSGLGVSVRTFATAAVLGAVAVTLAHRYTESLLADL
ncbi:hypothetical protein [Halosimplex halophilum]|uniref:hypothetical protein n=1 Tax=Halosimplex halophilum TaxID=2559572 RepID=UPI00107FC527|nr:hypothetical protein [Halosimplex halophilum]